MNKPSFNLFLRIRYCSHRLGVWGRSTKYNAKGLRSGVACMAERIGAKQRLHLPIDLLHGGDFVLTDALGLPTFHYQNKRLIKRLTIISVDGVIRKVFYPVFPPDRNAEEV